MYRSAARWILLGAMFVAGVAEARPRPIHHPDLPPPHDQFSAANPTEVRTRHLSLDLEVDFDEQVLRGSATHTIVNLTGAERFALDTRDLVVHAVSVDGAEAAWSLASTTRNGEALEVAITATTELVRIDYETTVTDDGLMWMNALQTTGGVAPFVYSFGQPDHTRDWIPIQDTPGVRMTWDATIRVPTGLIALMSAPNPITPAADGVHRFEMPYSVPPYLIALAVGRLAFRELGDRVGVYAEPELIDDAAWDLAFLPDMMRVAEDLLGPYPYDRYDLLLAPPSFRASGMENPMLNFINVLSAVRFDRELPAQPTYLIAHELAHSWAGDQTTCATWSDTWLNEGFATYLGHRILGAMLGPERAEIGFTWDRMNVESYVANTTRPETTVLHRLFAPNDPPTISSPINYSKGAIFLKLLEDELGREVFDTFLRVWFSRHAFRWVDDRAFVAELRRSAAFRESGLDVDPWIYGTGFPLNHTAPHSSALWDRVGIQAQRFRSGTPASALDSSGWTSFERDLFFWQIYDLVAANMQELDGRFGLSWMKTPPIEWLGATAKTRYAPAMPMFERYLMLGGHNVVFLYDELAKTAQGRAWALTFYQTARPRYANNIRAQVDRILNYTEAGLRTAA